MKKAKLLFSLVFAILAFSPIYELTAQHGDLDSLKKKSMREMATQQERLRQIYRFGPRGFVTGTVRDGNGAYEEGDRSLISGYSVLVTLRDSTNNILIRQEITFNNFGKAQYSFKPPIGSFILSVEPGKPPLDGDWCVDDIQPSLRAFSISRDGEEVIGMDFVLVWNIPFGRHPTNCW